MQLAFVYKGNKNQFVEETEMRKKTSLHSLFCFFLFLFLTVSLGAVFLVSAVASTLLLKMGGI